MTVENAVNSRRIASCGRNVLSKERAPREGKNEITLPTELGLERLKTGGNLF